MERNGPEQGSAPVVETPATPQLLDHDALEVVLQKECRMWQRKLYLRDWNVTVKLARLHEMPDRNAIGAIFPALERKDAQMFLLSPMDTPILAGAFLDEEELNYDLTIVHELLHLHLAPFTQHLSETEQIAEEQAINAISRCLIKAHAKPGKAKTTPVVAPATTGHYL